MQKELIEWIVNYIKSKDAFSKTLLSTDIREDRILFTYKDRKHLYLIRPKLDAFRKEDVQKDETVTCVTINSEENLLFLVKHWNTFLIPKLSLFFIDLDHSSRWVVSPLVHNRIADPESLEQGLRALADAAQGKIFIL
tara:strand:- start:2377 stop:2790 length:414 start_codon:yes stop_codon:yes gene_type:complete